MAERDVRVDSLERYGRAVERAEMLICEWVTAGRPLITLGGATGKAEVPHPLVRMIQDAEALADRFAKSLRATGKVGRPAGSGSAADREESAPPARIRRVK